MKVFAHRGLSGYYPENTILSFEKAIKEKPYGIELDVHKTKDNQLVVIHDEDVERTYLGAGLIKDYTLEELKKLKCRQYEFKENEKCKIPTLDDVLYLIKNSNIKLNIEIKSDIIHYKDIEVDVVNAINKFNLVDKVIISSFNHTSCTICKKLNPDIEVAILTEYKTINNKPLALYAKDLSVDAIHISKSIASKNLIDEAKKFNLPVRVYTINKIEYIEELKNIDVDAIFTDFCDKFK